MKYLCGIVLLFTTLAQCQASIISRGATENAYLDQVLDNLGEAMKEANYDPLDLPDQVFEFSFVVDGSVGLVNGYIMGLSRLNRVGDATLVVDANGDIMLSGDLEITHLSGGTTLQIEALGANIHPAAVLTIANSAISFSAVAHPDDLILQLKSLDLHDVGTVTVNIEALGSLDFITEILVEIVSMFIKDFMADLIQGPVQLLFNELLKNFPIDPPAGVKSPIFPFL